MWNKGLIKSWVFIVSIFFLTNGILFAQETREEQNNTVNMVIDQEQKDGSVDESQPLENTTQLNQIEEIKNEPLIQEKTATQEIADADKTQLRIKPEIKGYTYNLKRLLEQAQASINKVKEDIKRSEIEQRNEQREARVIEYFEIGNQLYAAGKLKEAEEEWRKAIEISQNSEMKDYIREAEKRAREDELAKKKSEQETVRQEKSRQAEFKKQQERQAREEKQKEEEDMACRKAENERQRQEEFTRQKERERLEREKQKQIAAEAKEKERLERERQEKKKPVL